MNCRSCLKADVVVNEEDGTYVCENCGNIIDDNTLVGGVEFVEEGERVHAIGHIVNENATRAYSGRLKGVHGHTSREATLRAVQSKIMQIASQLHLRKFFADCALRLYTCASEKNFVSGRRSDLVIGACIYIICRQEKSPHLLIDFADVLRVNVYLLGTYFLKLKRCLNLSLPLVDPSLFIHQYATKLGFDPKTQVSTTALRIIARMKRDWLQLGRKPSGICAAALLLASKIHNIEKSVEDIIQVVRISRETLTQRLWELAHTPAAHLTIDQFEARETKFEFDPPSFIKNLSKSNKPLTYSEEALELIRIEQEEQAAVPPVSSPYSCSSPIYDDQLHLSQQNSFQKIFENTEVKYSAEKGNLKKKQQKESKMNEMFANLKEEMESSIQKKQNDSSVTHKVKEVSETIESKQPEKEINNPEVSNSSNSSAKAELSEEDAEYRLSEWEDDEEINNLILTEEEATKKNQIWLEINKQYLEEQEERKNRKLSAPVTRPRRKKSKPNAKSNPRDAIQSTIIRSKISKKIDYDAMKGIFDENGQFQTANKPSKKIKTSQDNSNNALSLMNIHRPSYEVKRQQNDVFEEVFEEVFETSETVQGTKNAKEITQEDVNGHDLDNIVGNEEFYDETEYKSDGEFYEEET